MRVQKFKYKMLSVKSIHSLNLHVLHNIYLHNIISLKVYYMYDK